MKILFMVRRQYFDAIVAGAKTEEIRKRTKRWDTIAEHAGHSFIGREPVEAVFMCGRLVHRRRVKDIDTWERRFEGGRWVPGAEVYLGRPLSRQGLKDLGTGDVIVFYLGEECK